MSLCNCNSQRSNIFLIIDEDCYSCFKNIIKSNPNAKKYFFINMPSRKEYYDEEGNRIYIPSESFDSSHKKYVMDYAFERCRLKILNYLIKKDAPYNQDYLNFDGLVKLIDLDIEYGEETEYLKNSYKIILNALKKGWYIRTFEEYSEKQLVDDYEFYSSCILKLLRSRAYIDYSCIDLYQQIVLNLIDCGEIVNIAQKEKFIKYLSRYNQYSKLYTKYTHVTAEYAVDELFDIVGNASLLLNSKEPDVE